MRLKNDNLYMMSEKVKNLITISLFSLVPTLLIWIPFFLRVNSLWTIPLPQNGLATIVSNYDGPLYLVVAKTLYNKELISTSYQFPLRPEYYAAHFPLYPLLTKLFSVLVNYPYAMLIVTLGSSIVGLYYFHKLVSLFVSKQNALFLTFIFSVFPARWLIVRSTGSADPLFVASIIASIYHFKNRDYLKSGIWGAVAQLTKSAGVLLFVSYFIYLMIPDLKIRLALAKSHILERFNIKKTYPLLLIPLSLLLVFSFYKLTMGDFFAYFHSGDNIHLGFPPFQIFNYSAPWVGTSWIEEIIFIYLMGLLGIQKLFEKKEYEMASFTSVFLFFLLFVAHRDLMRYSLPIVPFLLIAFEDTLTKKPFKIALFVILIPIYLFSISFISQNVMPISNWSPFL